MAFYIIIHTFGLIVTTISSVEPPNSADATTDSDENFDKMLSTSDEPEPEFSSSS